MANKNTAPAVTGNEQDVATERLDALCINTIRTLAMDAVEKAQSGHPGMPMGAASMAYVLWSRFLRHNPHDPSWPNRDRFVLSCGHGSMLLYSLLHLTGYDLSLDEIKQFRQWGSRTPGHPEHEMTPGVEATTGPLGQGFGNGVGMAIAERYLSTYFNRPGFSLVDHFTYAICSDGDMMEGVSSEAASLAGHLKLGKLIYLYDDNRISIEGSTSLTFSEDVTKRFEAYGWHVREVDGDNLREVHNALADARAVMDRPSLIRAHTHIANGSPGKHDSASAHGSPLGAEEIKKTKEALGWPTEPPFYIPQEALDHFREAVSRGEAREAEWAKRFEEYAAQYPDLAREWKTAFAAKLPAGWEEKLPKFPADKSGMATRQASGKTLNAIAPSLPFLIGGSADLAPSTDTLIQGSAGFQESPAGKNFHFGVREHGMGAVLNGLALHGGLRPYGATFLVFSDYMRGAIRVAALSKLPVVYVFTHDSIGVGEDGPTHQPIEQLMSLRLIPNLLVIRPADANETAVAWRTALENTHRPTALILTRQKLPTFDRGGSNSELLLAKGAYVLAEATAGSPKLILIATGSEVSLAMTARTSLEAKGVPTRVVSMPSWELFREQSQEYRESVLPANVKARLSIEAGTPIGWRDFVGDNGDIIGINHFGASAPAEIVMKEFGFSAENVVAHAEAVLSKLAL